MSLIKLAHVDRFRDDTGTMRFYYRRRRGGGKRIPLPGLPGTKAFMEAYQAASSTPDEAMPKPERGDPGTFDRLVSSYYESLEFKKLKPLTQRQYRLQIERFIEADKLGHRLVAGMQREHVKKMMARRADRPAAANDVLKKLRILWKHALDLGWVRDDPTIKIGKMEMGEHHTWTDEEVEAFEARWPLGSPQRTAFALLLFTGQRVSDVSTMSWADIDTEDEAIHVVQEKTGTKLWIPLHDDLLEALKAWTRRGDTIVATEYGRTFSAKGLGNKMADAFDAAGLPDACVTHGIRKAASRRLAEAGCSAHEIASITGHKSLAEVERYTKAVNQRLLARGAMRRIASKRVPSLT